jgi:hypothetical protein
MNSENNKGKYLFITNIEKAKSNIGTTTVYDYDVK